MTADERTLSAVRPAMNGFLAALPAEAGPQAEWPSHLEPLNEAITVPTQVNYVGKAANLYKDAGQSGKRGLLNSGTWSCCAME